LHPVGDLFELNVKLRCQKVKEGRRILLFLQYDVPHTHRTGNTLRFVIHVKTFEKGANLAKHFGLPEQNIILTKFGKTHAMSFVVFVLVKFSDLEEVF
jgi:hypothetical protein